jgi:ATP-binding cassette subfamily B protein
LLPFLLPYRRQFILAGIALLVAACATPLAIPAAFRQMIDLGFAHNGQGNIEHVDLTFLALFAVACVLGIATAARFYMVSWLGNVSPPISAMRCIRMWSRRARSFLKQHKPAKCCRA